MMFEHRPEFLCRMLEDVSVILERDPAARTRGEALLSSSLLALWLHRGAHALYRANRRVLAQAVSMLGRTLSGIEIHPGAQLGRRVFIDHGCATVIGETAVVGDDVTLYHQVTLGAVGWWRDNRRDPGARRHPALGPGVVVGAGAMVLGPVHIGECARIGARALVLDDVAPHARIHARAEVPWPVTAHSTQGRRQ